MADTTSIDPRIVAGSDYGVSDREWTRIDWREHLPHFAAAGRRCVALDLPGFGASSLPDWPIGMAAYGRLLRDFCEKLDLGGATLVGNSMGGLLAVELALAAPQAFERLVRTASSRPWPT